MTKIQAQVIADSKNEFGNRITTMVVTFPRFILAELNTHRMFSRNSASSRAIPFEKMVKSVQENPFIPIAWQKDHKGMQGTEYFIQTDTFINELEQDEKVIERSMRDWLNARSYAIRYASHLSRIGVTKQLCNRLLEPFMWHTVIITATEWENMFALRCPKYSLFSENMPVEFRSRKDLLKYVHEVEAPEFKNQYDNLTELDWLKVNKGQAEIHMMTLVEAMWDAYNESTPKELKAGEWHIPFGDNIDNDELQTIIHQDMPAPSEENGFLDDWGNYDTTNLKIKIATARCARVSYTVVGEEDKEPNYENDIKLHDRLAESGHWSPFEHCARAMDEEERRINVAGKTNGVKYGYAVDIDSQGWSGNFRGFIQYRKTFQGENKTK